MLLLAPLEDDILLPSNFQEPPSTTVTFQSIFYSGLAVILASSHNTLLTIWVHPVGVMGIWMSGLLKYFLTLSSSAEGKSSFSPQTFPLVSGTRNYWKLVFLLQMKIKKANCSSALSISFLFQLWAYVFSSIVFFCNFFIAFHVTFRIQICLGF